MIESDNLLVIRVDGQPLPKQSFRALKSGGGYTDPRIAKWAREVALKARDAMIDNKRQLITGPVEVSISFWRKSNSRVDLDNLTKNVMDGLTGVVWVDDQQVKFLHLAKFIDPVNPGVVIEIAQVED